MFYCQYKELSIELYCSKALTHINYAEDVKKQVDHCFTDKKTRSAGKTECRNYFTIQKSGAIGKTACRNYFTDQKKRSARKKACRNYL